MTTQRITENEISDKLVSSLPTRPTAPSAFGGSGYTAAQMKAAFDKLPLFLVDRFNALINDIETIGERSLAAAMPTGIESGHSLADLIADVQSGALAGYLTVSGSPLATRIAELQSDIRSLEARIHALEVGSGEGAGGA